MWPELILPYEGAEPAFAGEPTRCGRGSAVIGAVRIGPGARIGRAAVIRADGQPVTLGAEFHLGDRATVHIATYERGTVCGDRVSVGRDGVVHACDVGSDVVIGDGAVILDGAAVGDGTVIAPGSTVYPRAKLPGGFLYAGSPARAQRPLEPGEVAAEAARLRARDEGEDADEAEPRGPGPGEAVGADVYVASTARLAGRVGLGAGSTVLFGCRLLAEAGPIALGAGSNVQDNTLMRTAGAGVVIGRDTTLGHNVRLADCRIGARCLIGIGASVAADTLIADDVMLAAGATTEPGQILEAGHLWGGRPARILAPLDADKRAMMARVAEGYVRLGRLYRSVQSPT